MGGFECADIINNRGNRIDMLAETDHAAQAAKDYQHLGAMGITTVREGIRWSVVERTPGAYDFSEVKERLIAGQEAGIQQLWDICHFGYPDGLVPTHPQFSERLAAVCKAFTQLYRSYTEDPLIITPINEISFISWLGGEARGTIPFAINSGFDIKYFLCRAFINAVKAIKEIDPAAQIMMVEPLIRIHPKEGADACADVIGHHEAQFQAMDMVTGRLCPELGGNPDYLNFAGFNYYYNNQWEHRGHVLGWCHLKRRSPFAHLLMEAYQRYKKPVVLSETGHFGEDKAAWMQLITHDCMEAMENGVDLKGICIYPVIDRPDWDTPEQLIPCGIWTYDQKKQRHTDEPYLAVVKDCISKMNNFLQQKKPQQVLHTASRESL